MTHQNLIGVVCRLVMTMTLITSLSGCGLAVGVVISKPETRIEECKFKNKAELIQQRGIPTTVDKISELDEIYYYNADIGWTGVVPVIYALIPVPVPLLLPTRKNGYEYHIHREEIVSAKQTYTEELSCFWGYATLNEGVGYQWLNGCK